MDGMDVTMKGDELLPNIQKAVDVTQFHLLTSTVNKTILEKIEKSFIPSYSIFDKVQLQNEIVNLSSKLMNAEKKLDTTEKKAARKMEAKLREREQLMKFTEHRQLMQIDTLRRKVSVLEGEKKRMSIKFEENDSRLIALAEENERLTENVTGTIDRQVQFLLDERAELQRIVGELENALAGKL